MLKVERTDHAIFRCGDWQLNQARWTFFNRQLLATAQSRTTRLTHHCRAIWRTTVRAIGNDGNVRQEAGKPAHCGRFRSALFTTDQNAADPRVDRIQDERAFETFLTDQRAERVDWTF
jgi:hypothetical protein